MTTGYNYFNLLKTTNFVTFLVVFVYDFICWLFVGSNSTCTSMRTRRWSMKFNYYTMHSFRSI